MLIGQSTPARPGCESLGSGASVPHGWAINPQPRRPCPPRDPKNLMILRPRGTPALVRTAALYPVQTTPKRCGCSVHLMPDKAALSDMMVPLQSSPAAGARWGPHEHLRGEYRRGAGDRG